MTRRSTWGVLRSGNPGRVNPRGSAVRGAGRFDDLGRCPRCDAAPGWRCVRIKKDVDGVITRTPLKHPHAERGGSRRDR